MLYNTKIPNYGTYTYIHTCTLYNKHIMYICTLINTISVYMYIREGWISFLFTFVIIEEN